MIKAGAAGQDATVNMVVIETAAIEREILTITFP